MLSTRVKRQKMDNKYETHLSEVFSNLIPDDGVDVYIFSY